MFNQFVLALTVIGSLIFHKILSPKMRNFLVPWLFAYYFLVITVVGSAGGESGLLHFVFTSMNFFPVMVICDGFSDSQRRYNPAWTMFLFFYAYMFAVGWTGYFKLDGTTFYLQSLLNTFCMGYFAARWICKTEGGLKKLLFPLLLTGCACVFYYVFVNQGLTSELNNYGRLEIMLEDSEGETLLNQNTIAQRIGALLPFIMLCFLYFDRRYAILKIPSMIVLVILGFVLVRTGSRTGAMAIFPCLWYIFKFSTDKKVIMKRLVGFVFIIVVFVIGILCTNRREGVLRAFDFMNSQVDYGGGINRMTTGRWEMYANNLRQFSSMELCFGKGCSNSLYASTGERIVRFRGANAHSIYVTVLYRSGILGLVLLAISIIVFFRQAGRLGFRGNMAKFLFLTWMLMGVGESWGMNGGAIAILAGLGFGLVVKSPVLNSDFGESIPMGKGWIPAWRGE